LRTAIRTMLIPTTGTHLRGVAGVYPLHANTEFLGFVEREVIQVGKGPTVQLALVINVLVLLATSHLRRISNMGQVLKNDSTARSGMLYNSPRQDVVRVPVEAGLLTRQLFEMSLGRLRSVGLQFAAETEVPAVNLFPMRRSEEVTSARHCWPLQAKVNSDHLPCMVNIGFRNMNHHMQPEFATARDEVGSGNLVSCVVSAEMRDAEGDRQLASGTRDLDLLSIPIQGIGVDIVANRTELALRHLHWRELRKGLATLLGRSLLLGIEGLMPLLPGEGTLESLSSLDTSLDEQITHQTRTSLLGVVVGGMVQLYAVLFLVLPTIGTYGIEGLRELGKCVLQSLSLIWRGMQLYSHGSVHTKSIPYMSRNCKLEQGEVWGAAHAAFPPAP